MQKAQRRERDASPEPFNLFAGFGKRGTKEEKIEELERDWIPFLERALAKARRLLDNLKG